MTDKYTRTFADFNNHPWPGKILPEYFEHNPTIGDGYMGTQGMAQGALSAYGPYHVIEGCEYQSPANATEWTGSVGYVMYSGLIGVVPAASGALSDAGSYLIYNSNGSFDVTGGKPTGVILAQNIGGIIYTTRTRIDTNSKLYLPNDVTVYGNTIIKNDLTISGSVDGNITHLGDISGTASYGISGYVVNTPAGGLTVGSRTLTDAEWTQLTNIGANVISEADWINLTGIQNVAPTSSPTFVGLTLSAGLTTSSTIDGVDISDHAANVNAHHAQSHNNTYHTINYEAAFSKNTAFNDNYGSSAGQVCEGDDGRLSNARTPVSHDKTYHSDINQELRTDSDVEFAQVLCTDLRGTITTLRSTAGALNLYGNNDISFSPDQPSLPSNTWKMRALGTQVYLYQYNSSTSTELGFIGNDGSVNTPLKYIISEEIYTQGGGIGSYSHVDDLQLLRDVKEWDVKEKALSKDFPNNKQKVWDVNTLPWVKAHSDINKMKNNDPDKLYVSSDGQKIGYLLSTIKKMLERQDELVSEIRELKKN